MSLRKLLLFFGLVLIAAACGSGGDGGGSPLAPSVTPPAGCSGNAVENIRLSFSSPEGFNVQVYGKTYSHTPASGPNLEITEDLVPCSYEITGQMLGRSLQISFGRTAPFEGSYVEGEGVERGSIAIDEGPNGAFGPAAEYCNVDFTQVTGNNAPVPMNFKVRFKVSKTNAINSTNGGCN